MSCPSGDSDFSGKSHDAISPAPSALKEKTNNDVEERPSNEDEKNLRTIKCFHFHF